MTKRKWTNKLAGQWRAGADRDYLEHPHHWTVDLLLSHPV